MLTAVEYRAFRTDKLELAEKRIVGYAAVFNKISEDIWNFREMIAPGAFTKTIKEADVKALLEHDPRWLLGNSKSKTLRLEEDDKGLRIEIDPPDTTAGRDAVESLKRGDLTAMSFGFRKIKDRWETKDNKPLRVLMEVALYDVSLVAYPAYPDTSVALRSAYAVGIKLEPTDGHSSETSPLSRVDPTQLERAKNWLKIMETEV